MNLQEDQGISHQQLPVIDMPLFSCDLTFSLSDSQGKNKTAHSIKLETIVGCLTKYFKFWAMDSILYYVKV